MSSEKSSAEVIKCIHELPFSQCALCASSDWHVGVKVASDDKFVKNLEENFKK